jgi:hypothetical protein
LIHVSFGHGTGLVNKFCHKNPNPLYNRFQMNKNWTSIQHLYIIDKQIKAIENTKASFDIYKQKMISNIIFNSYRMKIFILYTWILFNKWIQQSTFDNLYIFNTILIWNSCLKNVTPCHQKNCWITRMVLVWLRMKYLWIFMAPFISLSIFNILFHSKIYIVWEEFLGNFNPNYNMSIF